MAAEAIVFDVDGTLWDSSPFFATVLADITRTSAGALQEKLLRGDSIVTLQNQLDVSRAVFIRACVDRADELQLYDGIEHTLNALQASEIPIGILTSLPGESILLPLLRAKGLIEFFGSVFHAGNSRARKPSPLGLFKALEELNVQPTNQVFYVGDRDVDQKTAARANTSFAWASWGYQAQPPTGAQSVLTVTSEILAL
jgi:HAD superfamily hydrolase (TIGR01549 family)